LAAAHEVHRIAPVVRECRRAEAGERFVNGTPTEAVAPEQRDRVIPLRKSDLIDGLVAEGRLNEAEQATLRQLARMLGAIFHYQYLEELDRLREIYFQFDPEIDPKSCGPAKDIEAAYRTLSDEFVRVLTDANFIEITHDEITRAFAERARVRVKIKAPLEDYRDVRMFRRGHHTETIEVPIWFGLRQQSLEVVVYDDVVLMVVPILIKLASTVTVLFLVAGFYLGVSGTIRDHDTEQALAALSGLFALGAFMLRQWGNFHRQSLIHQKHLTDNVYYRNVNNNSGIFTYIIGEAEDQDWKEALLAYYGLLTAAAPLTREALYARIEQLLARKFGVAADFEIEDALAGLKRLDLLVEAGAGLSVLPLADALARLDREWQGFLRPSAGWR
jgi:hypothetical protein